MHADMSNPISLHSFAHKFKAAHTLAGLWLSKCVCVCVCAHARKCCGMVVDMSRGPPAHGFASITPHNTATSIASAAAAIFGIIAIACARPLVPRDPMSSRAVSRGGEPASSLRRTVEPSCAEVWLHASQLLQKLGHGSICHQCCARRPRIAGIERRSSTVLCASWKVKVRRLTSQPAGACCS